MKLEYKKTEKIYSSEATGSTRTNVPLRRLVDQGKTVLVIVFCPETNKSIRILEEAKIKKSIKRAYIHEGTNAPLQKTILAVRGLKNCTSIVFSNL